MPNDHPAFRHNGPPLLLTKRLTAFLHARVAASLPHVHTALLSTPQGRLLAHACAAPPAAGPSAQHETADTAAAAAAAAPARALRTQTAVAASLWAAHDSEAFADSVGDALLSPTAGSGRGGMPAHASAVTVQLASGAVFVVRRLACGLLLVCIGPSSSTGGADTSAAGAAAAKAIDRGDGVVGDLAAAAGPNGHTGGLLSETAAGGDGGNDDEAALLAAESRRHMAGSNSTGLSHGDGSSSGSDISAAVTGTAGVAVIRRHAEEIGHSLDERLGALNVPDEGMGDIR